MKTILLTRGRVAIVDGRSFQKLNRYVWSFDGHYAVRVRKGVRILMHREVIGAKPGDYVDHINQDGLDNRIANLRIATKSQNAQNQKMQRRKKSSRYKGVYWPSKGKRWAAQIGIGGEKPTVWLGGYKTEEEAAIAYDLAAVKYFREFASPNFKTINDYINASNEY